MLLINSLRVQYDIARLTIPALLFSEGNVAKVFKYLTVTTAKFALLFLASVA
jgi:hypothetical protein